MKRYITVIIIWALLFFFHQPDKTASRAEASPVPDGSRQIAVNSIAELQKAVLDARPGDVISLNDGEYDQSCRLSGKGTKQNPIVIQGRTKGKAILLKEINLEGEYISLSGLKFAGTGSVKIKGRGCRMTRCEMENIQTGIWIFVYPDSRNIEIDHCRFMNKDINLISEKSSQLMQIRVWNNNEAHHIHHNHFLNIPKGKEDNGYETIQLVTQGNPPDPPGGPCNTLIENNLFERCNGESEIISVKSNGNALRGNTFRECQGAVVLRHGHDNIVSGNFFFGDGEPGSGGVRLQGTGQIITNNYFHGLGLWGVSMMNGTEDKMYVRVENAIISHNTFINCVNALVIGINHRKYPDGAIPRRCTVANNIFFIGTSVNGDPTPEMQIVKLIDNAQPEEWKWIGNVAHGKLGIPETDGIRIQDPCLRFLKNGCAVPGKNIPAVKQSGAVVNGTEKDIFGVMRGKETTVGAAQFPGDSPKAGPLTKDMVGP